jgi:hypothetical protein
MPDAITDFDPAEFDVLSDEEAAKALYRPSRESLKLQQQFLQQQENEPDQSNWWERLGIGFNEGISGLESSVGGLFDIVGLPEMGSAWQWDARRRAAESQDIGDTLGVNEPWKQVAQGAAGMATQQLPTVAAAALGGLPLAAAAAGLQTAGSVQDQAEQAYEAQGLSHEEAIRRARMPALASGAITTILTTLMPGGTEKLAGMLFRGPAAQNAARQSLYQTARQVVKEAAKEAPEEMLDQIGQDVVARFSYDPDKPLDEIIQDAWEAGGWGIGTAGAVGTLGHTAGALSRARNRASASVSPPSEAAIPMEAVDANEFEVVTEAVPEEPPVQRLSRAPAIPAVETAPTPADEFEVVDPAPVARAAPQIEPAASQVDWEPVRRALLENMQGRSMDLSAKDFQSADAHIQSVLGKEAPSWEVLSDAGVIEATPNKNGTVNVRVAKEPVAAVEAPVEEPPPAPTPAVPPPALPPGKPVAAPAPVENVAQPVEVPIQVAEVSQPQPAIGPEAVRQLVAQSKLSAHAKRATVSALDVLQKSGLDTSRLQLELTQGSENGLAGSVLGSVIRLSESSEPNVGPEEVFHLLIASLPEAERAALESERLSTLPQNAPPEVRAGTMSTADFQQSKLPMEMYRFINADEYAAHIFADKTARAAAEAKNPGLWQKVTQLFAQLWESLKGLVKSPAASERIYRDMLEGRQKYDPERRIGSDIERRGTFAQNAQEAKNAAELAVDPKIEGESLLAQAADVSDLLTRFKVGELGSAVAKAFDFSNWTGIARVGETLNGARETYRQLKGRADAYRKARLAGEAGQQILRFGEMLEFAIADGERAKSRLDSNTLQRMVGKFQQASINASSKNHLLQVSKSIFNSALADAQHALKEEAKTDLEVATLEGEIRGIKEASESSEAMEQLLDDMMRALSASEEGRKALETGEGGAKRIRAIYEDLKKSAGETLHGENLLRWASYLLSKSPKLQNAIKVAQLSKQSGVRSNLTGLTKKFAAELSKDPVKAIRKAMREREKSVKDATGAEFVFRQMQQELLNEIEPLIAAADAGDLAAQIKSDAEYQALRKEILNDQTSFGGKPAKPFDGESTITLPSGRTIGFGAEIIEGDVTKAHAQWEEWGAAAEELRDWIANPQNADDPARRLHEANLQTLEDYFAGQQALMPENRSPLFSHALSVLNSVVAKTASRLTGSARAALRRLDQMHKWARDWHERSTHTLSATQRAAIKSHGLIGKGRSIVQANRIYQQRVGQELAASWQRQQGGHKVGDVLSSGEIVTVEDLAHLEAQSKAGFEALNLTAKYDRQITEDARGLKTTPNYRHALRTSPYLLPRMFDFALERLARNVAEAPNEAAVEDALNELWPHVGLSLLVDRNPEFAKKTAFDGPEGAFATVADLMRGNPDAVRTIDDLARELAAVSTVEPEQAKEIVLTEFGRIIKNWSNAVQEKVAARSSGSFGGDAKNSFTQARGDSLAPWTFYRTGFTTSDDISSHAGGMQSVAMDRVIEALESIDKDLDRQESELRVRTDELGRQGVPNASKVAIAEKEKERRQGKTYDSWQQVHDSRAQVRKALDKLRVRAIAESDFDYTFTRGTGALVGALIGNIITTVRNLSPIFLGRQLRLAGMSESRAFLAGLHFSSAETAKILNSFFVAGLPRAGFFLLRGMARGVPQLMKGEAREAYRSALRDVIKELSEDIPRRLKSVRELEASGLYSLPDKVREFDNQILGSILYRGRIPSREFQGKAKAAGYAAGLAEASVLAITTAAFPTIGDAAINAAMNAAMQSSIGPIQSMETRLRKLYNDWKNNGYPRAFDLEKPASPKNRLAAREVGLNENEISLMRRTYEMAGISFDQAAAEFFSKLSAGESASQFLTDEQRHGFIDMMINQMNRGSIGNAPLKLKDGSTLTKFIRPLYGFPVRAFANWESTLSVPTVSESSRARLWVTAMSSVGLGLLLTGAGGQLRDEAISRMLKRALYNQESQNRLPWEEPTGGRKIAGVARLAMESVPLLGILGNLVFPTNSPARASYEPTLVVGESAFSIAEYIKNAASAGDLRFGLPELISKFVPDARVVMNRLPSQEGRRLASNAVAELKRYAPADLARPIFKGAGAGASELSPWIQRMENYAMTRDQTKFMQAYQEAVAAARRMKKADPEKAVQNAFRSRAPETRALTRRMTDDERIQTLRRANSGPGVRLAPEIVRAQQNYADAAALIGIGLGRQSASPRLARGDTASSGSLRRVSGPPNLRRAPASFYAPRRQ